MYVSFVFACYSYEEAYRRLLPYRNILRRSEVDHVLRSKASERVSCRGLTTNSGLLYVVVAAADTYAA